MSIKILITDPISDIAITHLKDKGFEVIYKPKISNEELNNPYKEGPRTIIHPADPSEMSQVYQITYEGDNGSVINNECYDWSKNVSYFDSFSVNYASEEFNNFLLTVQ